MLLWVFLWQFHQASSYKETYHFQRNVLNVAEVGWNLGCNDEVTPVVAHVSDDETDERKTRENFSQWREWD